VFANFTDNTPTVRFTYFKLGLAGSSTILKLLPFTDASFR